MRIDIRDLQDKVRIDRKKIAKRAEFILKVMGEKEAELSLLFVNDSYIRRLNWKYRKINSKTDVLAFSMREGSGLSKDSLILGDIVISTETAKREAARRRSSIQKEISLYLIHGILHLLGYDDRKTSGRKRMRQKQRELLKAI